MDRSMFGDVGGRLVGYPAENALPTFGGEGGGEGREMFYFFLVWGLVSKGDTLMDNI